MTDVALFPIPECVSFPGTVFPLHVFEPRYRSMVQYCIEHDMPMGVCHTEKLVRPSKKNQTIEQVMSSNQATYKPYPVFSAGPCELVQTLEDGRLMINVHITQRYHAVEAKQTLPFSIYHCEPYDDHMVDQVQLEEAQLLQEKILKRLLAVTQNSEKAQQLLQSDEWQQKAPVAFSFELMSVLSLGADTQQTILEMQSPVTRLQTVLKIINQ